MPEPNLPPLHINLTGQPNLPSLINVPDIRSTLPELPEETRQKLSADYNLPHDIAVILMVNVIDLMIMLNF